jgi:hypothetical protein
VQVGGAMQNRQEVNRVRMVEVDHTNANHGSAPE